MLLPQSFSGFRCEWACLYATRFGVAALKVARSASLSSAVKIESSPAVTASTRVINQPDRVAHQVVQAIAGTLVGVRDGAALLEPPLAGCPDGSVDAAIPRRWR